MHNNLLFLKYFFNSISLGTVSPETTSFDTSLFETSLLTIFFSLSFPIVFSLSSEVFFSISSSILSLTFSIVIKSLLRLLLNSFNWSERSSTLSELFSLFSRTVDFFETFSFLLVLYLLLFLFYSSVI